MDTKGLRGGSGRNWETRIDSYALLILRIKQITNENILVSTGNSLSIYIYGRSILLSSQNQQNIVK